MFINKPLCFKSNLGKQEALDCESKHKFPFTREHFLVIIQGNSRAKDFR